ncbi:GNAT family N-acetyltransferase [Corynebacterium striatum]
MTEFNGVALGEYGLPGPLRDELVAAILAGAKTATSSLYAAYGDEPLPRVGEGEILLDSAGAPVAVLRTTDVDVAAWRAAHADFWGEHPLSDASLVVAQRIALVAVLGQPITRAHPADAPALARLEDGPPVQVAARLAAFPECFWVLREDSGIVAAVSGFATNRRDLTDDMYADAAAHEPDGAWQMIFSVITDPVRRGEGLATRVLDRAIADSRARGRAGLVLTCKDELVGFYARLGFVDEGTSASTHGGVVWHQMRLSF